MHFISAEKRSAALTDGRGHVAGDDFGRVVKGRQQRGALGIQRAAEALVVKQYQTMRKDRHLMAVLADVLILSIIHQTPAVYVFHA